MRTHLDCLLSLSPLAPRTNPHPPPLLPHPQCPVGHPAAIERGSQRGDRPLGVLLFHDEGVANKLAGLALVDTAYIFQIFSVQSGHAALMGPQAMLISWIILNASSRLPVPLALPSSHPCSAILPSPRVEASTFVRRSI